jgi:hypothetical protein
MLSNKKQRGFQTIDRRTVAEAGLPDFSWHNIPNWEKYTK